MWEKVAQSMGWPAKAIGWNALQERASQDSNFHWNHPSTAYASGLLATLAEFYAGAGVNRGLTEDLATQTTTLDYVKKVEGTVRFYGEGESAILDRLKKDGTSLLDAFVAQEQIVLRWNSENPGQKLVAIYPVEGTLWADHPLALLERYTDYDHSPLTNAQRDTYYEFTRYLLGDEAQKQVLAGGYRPVRPGHRPAGRWQPLQGQHQRGCPAAQDHPADPALFGDPGDRGFPRLHQETDQRDPGGGYQRQHGRSPTSCPR